MEPDRPKTPSNARGRPVYPPPSDQPFSEPQSPSVYAPHLNQQLPPQRSSALPRDLPYQRDPPFSPSRGGPPPQGEPLAQRELPPQRESSPQRESPHQRDLPSHRLRNPEPPITGIWNIPPRPKPGRKPAQDIPPTKRKQQNRDAQRAFRERRAARVGELEGVIQGLNADFDIKRAHAKAEFEHRERGLRQLVAFWQGQAANWEITARHEMQRGDQETRRRLELEQEVEQLRRHVQQSAFKGWNGSSLSSFSTSSRSSWDQISPTSRNLPPLPVPAGPASDALKLPDPSTFVACRDCGQDGRCFCMEKALRDLPEPVLADPGLEDTAITQPDGMEIDFTAMGKRRSTNQQGENQGEPVHSTTASITGEWPRRVSLQNRPQPVQMSGAPKGPGTCHSCLDDPERKRFCESLAGSMPPPFLPTRNNSIATSFASRTEGATTLLIPGMIPGASRPSFSSSDTATQSRSTDNRISCAEAYDVLSKDPNFFKKRNSKTYMESLKAQPAALDTECRTCNGTGCSAYEVDCASILQLMSTYDPGDTPQVEGTRRNELESDPPNDPENESGREMSGCTRKDDTIDKENHNG